MKESELSTKFQKYFSQWFYIDTEVTTAGTNRRIDLLLKLKKNPQYCFGIELKKDGHKRGNDLAKLLLQAHDYSKSEFIIFGSKRIIPVLVSPSISNMFIQIDTEYNPIDFKDQKYFKSFHDPKHEHHNLNGILGAFDIGEVRYIDSYRGGYAFIFRNKILWHEKRGLHEVNYNNYYKLK